MRSTCNDTKNVQVLKEKEKRKENEERESKKEKKQKKEIKRKKKEKLKEKEKVLTQTPVEQKRRFYESSNSEIYRNFLDWVDTNTPYVANHLYPISEQQFIALRGYYGSEAIVQNIMNLENRVDLRRRYRSLYLTLLNWLNRSEREIKN
jgi:cobalamin-dependent methionine synthase I